MKNGDFLIVRIDPETKTVPYRGAIAHVFDREEAFRRLEVIQSNPAARDDYAVLRVYKAKKP